MKKNFIDNKKMLKKIFKSVNNDNDGDEKNKWNEEHLAMINN
jgi:hypothetical protein